jgi:hypothetical protein
MYTVLHSEAEVAKEEPQNQTKSMTSGWTGGGWMESVSEEGRTCQGQHLTYNKVHLLQKNTHIVINTLLE